MVTADYPTSKKLFFENKYYIYTYSFSTIRSSRELICMLKNHCKSQNFCLVPPSKHAAIPKNMSLGETYYLHCHSLVNGIVFTIILSKCVSNARQYQARDWNIYRPPKKNKYIFYIKVKLNITREKTTLLQPQYYYLYLYLILNISWSMNYFYLIKLFIIYKI